MVLWLPEVNLSWSTSMGHEHAPTFASAVSVFKKVKSEEVWHMGPPCFWSGLSWTFASQMCHRDEHFLHPYRRELLVTSEGPRHEFSSHGGLPDAKLGYPPNLEHYIWTCLNWVGLFSKTCRGNLFVTFGRGMLLELQWFGHSSGWLVHSFTIIAQLELKVETGCGYDEKQYINREILACAISR
jgi:hypothetical protein